jgi:hypothetical protein
MGRIVNGASTGAFVPREHNALAPGQPLDIIPLRQIGCGCSSVVEHLLAKEDVASSSLVTRSSPENFRGWSECAEASRRRTAQKRPSYGWQASFDALRLFIAVAVSPRTVIHRIDGRPEATSQRAQRRTFPHTQPSFGLGSSLHTSPWQKKRRRSLSRRI